MIEVSNKSTDSFDNLFPFRDLHILRNIQLLLAGGKDLVKQERDGYD
jgi:hypothetical protein